MGESSGLEMLSDFFGRFGSFFWEGIVADGWREYWLDGLALIERNEEGKREDTYWIGLGSNWVTTTNRIETGFVGDSFVNRVDLTVTVLCTILVKLVDYS